MDTDLKKRELLKKSSLLISAAALLAYFPLSLANVVSKEGDLEVFKKLSLLLTAQNELSDELVRIHFKHLLQHEKKPFRHLLQALAKYDNDLKSHIRELQKNPQQRIILNKIIKIWYLGVLNNKTISISSYKQSLAWRMMGTTPPGISL